MGREALSHPIQTKKGEGKKNEPFKAKPKTLSIIAIKVDSIRKETGTTRSTKIRGKKKQSNDRH